MRGLGRAVAVGAVVALGGASASGASADDGVPTVVDGVFVDVPGVDTPRELAAFLDSGAPKTVGIDTATGRYTWVHDGQDTVQAFTTGPGVSRADDACLVAPGVPSAAEGLTGAGTPRGRP